jgi:hypothetical protein
VGTGTRSTEGSVFAFDRREVEDEEDNREVEDEEDKELREPVEPTDG